jgi:2-isopropylmalate synthase
MMGKDLQLYDSLFTAFKKLADAKKSGVNDEDLFALLDDQLNINSTGNTTFSFSNLTVMCGSDVLATATVTVTISETQEKITDAATGHGPVNAIINAINRIVGVKNILSSYEVKAVSEGSDSPGQVVVRIKQVPQDQSENKDHIEDKCGLFSGRGTDEDILVASTKAYINALNKMLHNERRYTVGSGRRVNV